MSACGVRYLVTDCKRKIGDAQHLLLESGLREDVITELCKLGANVNVTGNARYTPLHFRSWLGDVGVCKVLLRLGADPHRQNANGKIPMDLCPRPSTTYDLLADATDPEINGRPNNKCIIL